MNKYKRALITLARVAFMYADETEEGDKLVRQTLYRHLCAVGIAKYKDGNFVYDRKRKNKDCSKRQKEELIKKIEKQLAEEGKMTDEEMIENLKCVIADISEQCERLKSENAALHKRLEKMVELPCKIGDKFYIVNDCPPEIEEKECCAFTFAQDGEVLIIDGLDCHYSLKIVYLLKEDAEARLEELKGE